MRCKNIKFRAFQKSTKTILPINTLEAIITSEVRLTDGELSDIEINQFTGFLDCEGKEIFEGDRMIDIDVELEEDLTDNDVAQQVYYSDADGCWMIDESYAQNKRTGSLLSSELKRFKFKVIGNIYLNPKNAE